MSLEAIPLSTTALIALTDEQLADNGYHVVRDVTDVALPAGRSLIAEDDYSVIAVVAFETWAELASEWEDAQAALVSLLSRRLVRQAPKAWDGYLVLLCMGTPPDRGDAVEIERDTTRIRKILATGDILKTTADIARILDIFMPLDIPAAALVGDDVLATLPELMRHAIDPRAMQVVINAFQAMEPPLERLHELGSSL